MIINSILDTDLYKFTIQQFIFKLYPTVEVEYAFHNRDKTMVYTQEAYDVLVNEINGMSDLSISGDEWLWLFDKYRSIFDIDYLEYIKDYRFDPKQVDIKLINGQLDIKIRGKWIETVLWEVPLMALISEIYFKYCDTNWINDDLKLKNEVLNKAEALDEAKCKFADFGTRRRRNKETQDIVVMMMSRFAKYNTFTGTSNPYFAMKYKVPVIGTMAHEVICAISALESMNRPNKVAMEKWREIYKDKLSIFLPDTYGINSFFKDFDQMRSYQWKGVRHDSGCPYEFTDKMIAHYASNDIDPTSKIIVFSDSLNYETAIKLSKYCEGKIMCSFGIGTHFTNDFKKPDGTKSKPMNMVIKLVKCNGENVCKLSQNPEKAMGDPAAIRLMKHLHFGQPL